jgi:protease-4
MTDAAQPRAWPWIILGGIAFLILLMAVLVLATVAGSHRHRGGEFGGFGNKIGVVDLEGVIIEPDTVVRELKDFGDDDSIKAIIIHINTPGGGAAASQEIYSEVRRLRDEKKKTIVADVGTLGASGGYYVASGTSKIYADPASVVGSIGVISQWVNYADLMKWAKLKDVTFKAGALKDTGNPAREMTPEEKAYVQGLIDDMHQQFIHAVADGRHIKVEQIQKLADGRVWTGDQALALNLVDKLGDFQTAVKETARSVGIKGEPELVHPERERRTLLDLIFGDFSGNLDSLSGKLIDQHPSFYYLWR